MSYRTIQIIRIVLAVLAIIFFIWLIIWIFRPDAPTEEVATETNTTQQENFAVVRFQQIGSIVSPEDHYQIDITISDVSRRIDIYQGYNFTLIKSESFNNTQASYDAFYAGLQSIGFFNTREDKNNYDRDGYCPLGTRYTYQAGIDIAVPDFDAWSASCSARAGTFAGNKSQTKTMFKEQIPDYSTFVKDVRL